MGVSQDRDPSLGQLFTQVTTDVQTHVRDQIALTKVEISSSAKQAVGSSAMLIAAGTLGFLGFIFLLITAAYGLIAAGVWEWAAFLIVAVVLIIIAAILALVGKKRLENIKGPERAIASLEATKTALQGDAQGVIDAATTMPALPFKSSKEHAAG